MPALMEALPERMLTPMESSGRRPRERERAKAGVEAWKGIELMVDLELGEGRRC
jgi:hypothetical protein